MKVILNCLLPIERSYISATMSVLQSFLKQHRINVETKYWNLSFVDILNNFQIQDKEVLHLLPFLSHIALFHNDKSALKNIVNELRIGNPQYTNISKTYYAELIAHLSNNVYDTFISELKEIKIEECSLFGISSHFFQWIPGNILAELVKKINPNVKIVIGGFGTKKEAIALMQNFNQYDYAVWGEGEFALLGLCKHLENPSEHSLSEVQHLVYRENNILRETKVKSVYLDLDSINPDFSSYFNQQKNKNIAGLYVPLEGSRGCHWGKCKFCFMHTGYKNRCKSVDEIILLIKSIIKQYEMSSFAFVDNDLVSCDLQTFNRLLDLLIDLRQEHPVLAIQNAEVITKGLDASIIKKMSLAGIKAVQIGYEAINDTILKKINKKNTLSSNILFIKWARLFNIDILDANIITNLIEETDTEIIDSIKNLHFLRFYLKRNVFQHSLSTLAVMSTSPYYKYLETNNLLTAWEPIGIFRLLPQKYINDTTNKFDIFFHRKKTKNPLWENFEDIEKYYLDNSYYYQITEKEPEIYL